MIEAVIFDLDGTLVQTERLKARSYACAAAELCPDDLDESAVVEAYKEVVGLSRREVAGRLMERFGLETAARARMGEFGVKRPWQAFVQVRLGYYEAMLADTAVLRGSRWPHSLALLDQLHRDGRKLALATMSRCRQASRVLDALDLNRAFDFIVTRDDVDQGKPDPEMYLLAAGELAIDPSHCLAIEDSPSGVQAALAAGMSVVALATPFTRRRLRKSDLLPPQRIVEDHSRLASVVANLLQSNSE